MALSRVRSLSLLGGSMLIAMTAAAACGSDDLGHGGGGATTWSGSSSSSSGSTSSSSSGSTSSSSSSSGSTSSSSGSTSSSSGGSSSGGLSGTGNPESVGFGARKTITIDGANTAGEWGADTLLIRDPAADDARLLGTNWCAHEAPWDYAALHAAWDDEYLYLGIQYVNVTDVIDPSNLGSSNGSPIKGMDLIQFVAFETVAGNGYSTGGDMWGKDHEFTGVDHPEFQLYFHSNFSQQGTYFGAWDGAKLTQTNDGASLPALKGKAGSFFVGSTLPGVDPHGDDASPGQYGAKVIDYLQVGHDPSYDTFFELQIPLTLLNITAATLDQATIGVFAGNGDGSGVDSIPNDPATSSTPGVSASNSPLEWSPVDDQDQYTALFARVGTPN